MEFTCDVCGASGHFTVTGDEPSYRVEIFMVRKGESVCKEREDHPSQPPKDELQCPHLGAAIDRVLAARRG